MKKLFMLICLFIGVCVMAATPDDSYTIKDGHVVVEKVIPFSISMQDASSAVNSWFVTHLNDSNQTLKNSSDNYYVAKILTPHLSTYAMGMWHTMGELTIEVRFKEDRMKVSVSCGQIMNENIDKTGRSYYSLFDAAPLADKHDQFKTNIYKKNAEETFKNLILYMNSVVNDIESAVASAKDEDDW